MAEQFALGLLFFCFCLLSSPVFPQGICLSEAGFQILTGGIKKAKENPEARRLLTADLRLTLSAREARLRTALKATGELRAESRTPETALPERRLS